MKTFKVRLCIIVALLLAFVAAVGTFLGITAARANRYVTLSGTSIFNVSNNAQIWAHREVETDENNEEISEQDSHYYILFALGAGDTVSYRRALAYHWFENANDKDDYAKTEEEGGEEAPPVTALKKEGYLNLAIGFEEVNFEKFTIAFETQQYSMTEDEKTVNYVIFLPEKDAGGDKTGKLNVFVTSDKELAEEEAAETVIPERAEERLSLDPSRIIIRLAAGEKNGEYAALIYNANTAGEEVAADKIQHEKFENVGEMYAKYVSSSTKPVTPIIFSAELPEGADTSAQSRARMTLYNMNGQSFVLNRDSEDKVYSSSRSIETVDDGEGKKHYTGGQVNDTMPPVLCLDKGLTHIAYGSEISFGFTAVDVLTQSPTTQMGYFLLDNSQYGLNATEKTFDANVVDEEVFKKVEDSHDQYIFPHVNHYLPDKNNDIWGAKLGDDLKPLAAIKVYLELKDTSSTGTQSTYVFLDWYVADEYLLKIDGNDYIAVAEDKKGASYNLDAAVLEEYQKQVDEAAKDLLAGKDDFYLPSFESLVTDNAVEYADMTYSIYYLKNGTQSSNTGKNASQLSIDLDQAGEYKFTVYASDGTNDMWYHDADKDKDEEFSSNDIWTMNEEDEEDGTQRLPWFTFSAGVADLKIEDPGEQDMAYVGTSYTAKAFEIEGISTKESYALYLFNNEAYFDDRQEVLDYEGFMANKQTLFTENRNYFKVIPAAADLEKGSEEYLAYNGYGWTPSSRTFTPLDENSFYLIVCTVTSTQFVEMPAVKAYMGIAASAAPDPIKGENTWVKDNLASIILLSIAGAALVGIILLSVIRPKDKGDIDEQYEAEVAAKAKKDKK